jgi:hypothetical protein
LVLNVVGAMLPSVPLPALPTFFEEKMKNGKSKKGTLGIQKHGGEVKYAGHFFMHKKSPTRAGSVICIKK